MATVDKNFKVKHGLVVEGTTATVNGDNIVTEDAIQTITNKTTPNLTINDGTGNGGSVYAEGNNVTIAAANDLYLNTNNADINLQPDGAAKIWGKEIATKEYVDGQVPDNTDGLSEGTTNKYFTDQRAKLAASDLLVNATKTNIEITASPTGDLTITAENGVADSNTDDLAEGSTNLYFTAERAQDAVGNSVGQGLTYDDAAGAVKANINSFAGAIGTHSSGWLEVKVDGTSIDTSGSGNQLRVLTGEGSPVASKTFVNNLVGDNTVDGTSGNTITDRIATAVANLVDGAPDLLNTLNELAAAIGDDENYATTVAGLVAAKQDTLIAGNGININPSTDEISVDDTVIASVDYVDTNFVNVADLPGQLDDYVPLTQKGANDGVATLDSTGNVPADQLGNQFITDVIDNLYMAGQTLRMYSDPSFTDVKLQTHSKLMSNTNDLTVAGGQEELFNMYTGEYDSAEIIIKARKSDWSDRHMTKILVTCDGSGNVAITEYGSISTNQDLFTVEATGEPWGPNHVVRIKVTPLANINVKWYAEQIGA